jgi:fumarylacetoacetase
MDMDSSCNDPALRSWVESANPPGTGTAPGPEALTLPSPGGRGFHTSPSTDFPIQNLPYGVFTSSDLKEPRRIGCRIGDFILDIPRAIDAGLLNVGVDAIKALRSTDLNSFMALGRVEWQRVRRAISSLLRADNPRPRLRDDAKLREHVMRPVSEAHMLIPARIGDYTDFYASIHHATNVGSMFRPDNPLLPNYRHLPVGYHGRASSIVVSGTGGGGGGDRGPWFPRPMGQIQPDESKPPVFGPSRLLDYEMELGAFIGPGNVIWHRIPMAEAREHLFGMVIVNDWSARDVQKWEYQPLGPFNAKNFATTISPWVVTMEALEPFRVPPPPRAPGDPELLDYLRPVEDMAYDITVEVWIQPAAPAEPAPAKRSSTAVLMAHSPQPTATLISRGNFRDMYWTLAQMLVHHTSTGCNMRAGDLIASGTISGPAEESRGCLLERTWRGTKPVRLADGTERKFLQDGDEVIMRAYCEREGAARIGFGECRGTVAPATPA